MNIATLITGIPSDLFKTYVRLTRQTSMNKQEIVSDIIGREFKINTASQSELDSLDRKLFKQHGCHLDEWLIEYIEDKIIKLIPNC